MRAPARPAPRSRGFTALELLVALAAAAVLGSIAWPSYTTRMAQARRSDAVAALDRVLGAQELYRSHNGLYATSLDGLLGTGPLSPRGLYEVRIEQAAADFYRATASARAGSGQAADRECPRLTLSVQFGLPEYGPSLRCWNR